MSENFTDLGEPVSAMEVQDEFVGEILVSKLKSYGIPAFLKHSQFGEVAKVYCGRSNFSVSVMVPSSKLDEAIEILSEQGEAFDFSEAENTPVQDLKIDFPFKSALAILCGIAIVIIILYGIFS